MRTVGVWRTFCASIALMSAMPASVAQAQSPPIVIRAEKLSTVVNPRLTRRGFSETVPPRPKH